MQKQEDSSWRVVQCGSRFLTAAEIRYAAIELELLGIAWAINPFSARPDCPLGWPISVKISKN